MTSRNARAMAGISAAVVLVLSAVVGCSSNDDSLDAAITSATDDPRLAEGAWSIQAVDLDSGDVIYERNPAAPLVPGSIQKTYTTGAALTELGPDSRITTPVYGLGDVDGRTLTGDLVLVGRGDFSFGLRERPDGDLIFTGFDHNEANTGLLPVELAGGDPLAGLRSLARQVAERVNAVSGSVVVDNRYFEPETEWPDGRIDSIWVNENVLDVVLTPGAVGTTPQLRVLPDLRFVTVENKVSTVAGDDVDVEVADLGNDRYEVTGTIGSAAGETVRNTRVQDPAAFARKAFQEVLGDAGVVVQGADDAAATRLPAREQYRGDPLATFASGTTRERVNVVQKVSYNRGADLFACLIAVKRGSTDCVDGVRAVLDNAVKVGAPEGSVFLFDPAGSIDYNRSSARGQVGFLRGTSQGPNGDLLRKAMPVAGVDGSLAELGKGTAAEGKIEAKTGTRVVGYPATGGLFYAAQAYSGYLTGASGRNVVFSVIFNATAVDDVEQLLAVHKQVGEVVLALQAHA